ncbi:MAG: hypothetical protein AAFQ50_12945, partial [Pseudomonadota bacterium]
WGQRHCATCRAPAGAGPSERGRILGGLALRLGGVATLGALLVVPSELWFYPVDLTPDFWMMGLLYGLLGWAMIAVLAVFDRWDSRGWWIAAGLFGFLAEGLVVAELYGVLPFSILWTPLAWHAVVTVFLAFLWLRSRLARGAVAGAVASAALGVALGVWNGWMWNVREAADGSQSFDWQPLGPFAAQVGIGWLVFVAGHWGWSRLGPRLMALNLKTDLWALTLLFGGLWAVSWLVPLFPWSLALPGLTVLSVWALRHAGRGDRHVPATVSDRALLWTALIPVCAIATYATYTAARPTWEVNAYTVFILGIPATLLWARAHVPGRKNAVASD